MFGALKGDITVVGGSFRIVVGEVLAGADRTTPGLATAVTPTGAVFVKVDAAASGFAADGFIKPFFARAPFEIVVVVSVVPATEVAVPVAAGRDAVAASRCGEPVLGTAGTAPERVTTGVDGAVFAAGGLEVTGVLTAPRKIAVTAPAALATADLTAAATVTAGTGAFAVVVHVPADWREPQLVVLVWQQPQSCVTLGWSLGFACAPFVPWVL